MNTSTIAIENAPKSLHVCSSDYRNYWRQKSVFNQLFVTYMRHFPERSFHERVFPAGTGFNLLLYCTTGSAWYQVGKRRYPLMPHQYVMIPASTCAIAYGADAEVRWTGYALHFEGPDLYKFNASFPTGRDALATDIGWNQKGMDLWAEIYALLSQGEHSDNFHYAALCLPHLLGTFLYPSNGATAANAGADLITETIAYMQQQVAEKRCVEDFASRCQLSASYFSTLFRKATGLPPLEYFIQLKMQYACQLLSQQQLKVKEVADASGYEDPFHFSRLFKKYMKMSPQAYRSRRTPGLAPAPISIPLPQLRIYAPDRSALSRGNPTPAKHSVVQ